MVSREHLEACGRLEILRDRGYTVTYFGVPYHNAAHQHFQVRARVYGMESDDTPQAWGVTLTEAVDKLIEQLPPDIRDAMMGVILLPNPLERA